MKYTQDETKIINELTKHIPKKVAKRIIHLRRLAIKNNIHTLFTKIYEKKEYLVDLDLIEKKKVTIWITEVPQLKDFPSVKEWIDETIKRGKKITIDLDNPTTETTNIETTEQAEEYTEKELKILNKLLNYIPRKESERVIYLMKLAKENNISELFATVHENDKQYTKLFLRRDEIEIITGERPPLEKYQSVKEWLDEMDRREKRVIIAL